MEALRREGGWEAKPEGLQARDPRVEGQADGHVRRQGAIFHRRDIVHRAAQARVQEEEVDGAPCASGPAGAAARGGREDLGIDLVEEACADQVPWRVVEISSDEERHGVRPRFMVVAPVSHPLDVSTNSRHDGTVRH
jgi:hypothetical protein